MHKSHIRDLAFRTNRPSWFVRLAILWAKEHYLMISVIVRSHTYGQAHKAAPGTVIGVRVKVVAVGYRTKVVLAFLGTALCETTDTVFDDPKPMVIKIKTQSNKIKNYILFRKKSLIAQTRSLLQSTYIRIIKKLRKSLRNNFYSESILFYEI